MAPEYENILAFWFGALDEHGCADEAHSKRWWTKDPAFDKLLWDTYGELHAAVTSGERDAWLEHPRGRLAYVIVCDQFSRNMFRDTAEMYAWDPLGLQAARQALQAGDASRFGIAQRSFLAMPLMHSEALDDQEACVALFDGWAEELSGPAGKSARGYHGFAVRHRDIVARFGRFPHRNALLGRPSTPAELAFLEQPGSSF